MTCADENELLGYLDGILVPERSQSVGDHLAGCAACRAVLAGLARAEAIHSPPPAAPTSAHGREAIPKELLRETLRADAPLRERVACTAGLSICLTVLVIDLFAPAAHAATPGMRWFMLALSAWFLCALFWLRRGNYHPALSWTEGLLEASAPGIACLITSASHGPEFAFRDPAMVIWGTALVLGSIRANPRLSLTAGGLAAALSTATYLALRPSFTQTALELEPFAQVIRAGFLLLGGVAGALVGTYFVRASERALRAVREQDLMGKYVLHERLGAGGMAEVFRATYCPEGGFRKVVAVKRVLPSLAADADFVEMFLEEARLCATLAHPNVVQVHDCGRFRDAFILAMEFVDGAALSKLLEGGPLAPAAVSYLGAEIARALEYIHSRTGPDLRPLRLVHRDLNPPNVLISRLGEVKVADFGVAYATVRAKVGERDAFYGKLAYASPEQIACEPVDGRSDLYLLGLTLLEAATGRSPAADHEALVSTAPPPLRGLLRRLLEPRRARRPPSASAVLGELLELTGELAPYPRGQPLLAERVARACARQAPARSDPPTELDGQGQTVSQRPAPAR